jgi:hypothetical protein
MRDLVVGSQLRRLGPLSGPWGGDQQQTHGGRRYRRGPWSERVGLSLGFPQYQ